MIREAIEAVELCLKSTALVLLVLVLFDFFAAWYKAWHKQHEEE